MANLGSEVARLCMAIEHTDAEQIGNSKARALHIVDELMQHPSLQGRTKEIELLRSVIEDVTSERPKYGVRDSDLEEYFRPFAMRALQGR